MYKKRDDLYPYDNWYTSINTLLANRFIFFDTIDKHCQ